MLGSCDGKARASFMAVVARALGSSGCKTRATLVAVVVRLGHPWWQWLLRLGQPRWQ